MYSKNDKVIIWLNSIEGLTYKKKEVLLSLYNNAEDMFDSLEKDKKLISINIEEGAYNLLLENKSKLEEESAFLEKKKIIAITKYNSNYPNALLEVDNPPFVLYCVGDISLLKTNCIGIVGSRKITNYGRVVTEKFATTLAKNGLTIVSGLASGVDTIAHQSALNVKGKTIAVLAGGFGDIYPATNHNLAVEISKSGLLITEYSYNEKSEPYHFPLRNRIIAGISKGVLITEASEKSGSMHTKNYALDYGKDLFLVPGNITSPSSAGCNNAIKNMQGAIVLCPEDILKEYGIDSIQEAIKSVSLNMDENSIYELVSQGEIPYQELLIKTKLEAKYLNSLLTSMQIRGIIKKLAGNIFVID